MGKNLRIWEKVNKRNLRKAKIQIISGCILTIMGFILLHYIGYIPLFWTMLMSLFAISAFLNLYRKEKKGEKFEWKIVFKKMAAFLWLILALLVTIGVIYEMLSPEYQDMAVGAILGYFLFKLDEMMKIENKED